MVTESGQLCGAALGSSAAQPYAVWHMLGDGPNGTSSGDVPGIDGSMGKTLRQAITAFHPRCDERSNWPVEAAA
jgi:hypothetical protein